jgi:hypothetical protein
MVIESRMIVGGAAALAVVGGVLWLSTAILGIDKTTRGQVEVEQLQEPAWAVEIKELVASDMKTAAR